MSLCYEIILYPSGPVFIVETFPLVLFFVTLLLGTQHLDITSPQTGGLNLVPLERVKVEDLRGERYEEVRETRSVWRDEEYDENERSRTDEEVRCPGNAYENGELSERREGKMDNLGWTGSLESSSKKKKKKNGLSVG